MPLLIFFHICTMFVKLPNFSLWQMNFLYLSFLEVNEAKIFSSFAAVVTQFFFIYFFLMESFLYILCVYDWIGLQNKVVACCPEEVALIACKLHAHCLFRVQTQAQCTSLAVRLHTIPI